MSFWDRDLDEWFRRFTGFPIGRFGFGTERARGGTSNNIFNEFEEMRREMERMAEQTIQDIEQLPKDLIREYQTPEGGRVREVGPIVYGYSVTVGSDGKPVVREFGNVRPATAGAFGAGSGPATRVQTPQLVAEREPLADIVTSDKEIKAVVEMPGISKQDININAYDNSVEVSSADTAARKYHTVIELPAEADIDTARSTYNNGILEIIFNKKASTKPKGKQIKVE